ncbi:uncharacterized protein LOC129302908 [Prosopis cineraria]|uniref:uncharacterized protein LOC129302908 n=1 Tax=Prosopis cineraria TaxID=364024 RepID=UPI00240FC2F1|nr:uncharacterized protein LOC129302908 [Prosopis cineraria]
MAARILKETKSLSGIETQPQAQALAMRAETVHVKCYCCELTEESTVAYVGGVREKYQGRWICGLCAEAVKDEEHRSEGDITVDEAVKSHKKFRQQFTETSPPNNATEDLIKAMKQLMLRSLESPRNEGMTCRPLGRSQSCFSTMTGSQKRSD